MIRKGKKLFICAGFCILMFTAANLNSYADTTAATESQPEPPQQNMGVMAKITAIDSSTMTVTLSQMPEKPAEDGTGTTPPETTGETPAPPETTDGTSTPPEKPEMNFTGESKTYTIPSTAVITKGMNQESASVSDLAADSVIQITFDGETITAINIQS